MRRIQKKGPATGAAGGGGGVGGPPASLEACGVLVTPRSACSLRRRYAITPTVIRWTCLDRSPFTGMPGKAASCLTEGAIAGAVEFRVAAKGRGGPRPMYNAGHVRQVDGRRSLHIRHIMDGKGLERSAGAPLNGVRATAHVSDSVRERRYMRRFRCPLPVTSGWNSPRRWSRWPGLPAAAGLAR